MPLRKHSISIRGHQTSLSIEDEFWFEIKQAALEKGISTAGLITQIDDRRDPEQNLSSCIRVFVLNRLKHSNEVLKQENSS